MVADKLEWVRRRLFIWSGPRPTGEAARAVWTLYDVPLNQEVGIGTHYQVNDGTDWALGTPSYLMMIMHDGGMDLDGNLWFTSNAFNKNVTLGRINAKTGEVMWTEPSFSGDAEYYTSDIVSLAREEASHRATERLARNVVDRIVEDW